GGDPATGPAPTLPVGPCGRVWPPPASAGATVLFRPIRRPLLRVIALDSGFHGARAGRAARAARAPALPRRQPARGPCYLASCVPRTSPITPSQGRIASTGLPETDGNLSWRSRVVRVRSAIA